MDLDDAVSRRRSMNPSSQRTSGSRKNASIPKRPTAEDLAQARRIAAYGEPRGPLGILFYSLSAGPRRRTLRRELRETQKKLAEAEKEVDRLYLEYARGLHARAVEQHIPSLQPLNAAVDHAVLRQKQVEADRPRRQIREIQEQRVRKALTRLADEAFKQGHERLDPQGLKRYEAAQKQAASLAREAWLRELGIEMYDAKAVLLGRIMLLLLVGIAVAAGVMAWKSGDLPFR